MVNSRCKVNLSVHSFNFQRRCASWADKGVDPVKRGYSKVADPSFPWPVAGPSGKKRI